MTRLTLFKKILVFTLLLSILPLLTSSLILFYNLESTSFKLTAEIAETSDRQASESLQMRARQVAESITDFLKQCESDLLFLARTRHDQQMLLNFYDSRRGEVWERSGSAAVPDESREMAPLYRSIAVIDKQGQEQLVIKDGSVLPQRELRNVANPADTEFRCEDYFSRVRNQPGKLYVAHLTGLHVSKQEQLAGALEPDMAYGGKSYRGVIRFASALFDNRGEFNGMIVLSLDHRHLMEFSQHIDPGHNFLTIFPSYKSGNYAFIFDDEGWIITHPKYWDIRGLDAAGKLVPPYSSESSPADINSGRIPFNLDHAGFIHPNYPRVAAEVRQKKGGFVDITNVGGAKKIMAFAPILYDSSDYGRHGIFGGITIGFQVDQFHDAARKGSRLINQQLGAHRNQSAAILLLTAVLAAVTAWVLSRNITHPLLQLTEGAQRLARGDAGTRVAVASADEIGNLASTFNMMADELDARKLNLLATLDELKRSRKEILDERNFKTSVLESISSAILTFSPAGTLTSINGIGREMLGGEIHVGTDYRSIFSGWPVVSERIAHSLAVQNGYGREPLTIPGGGEMTHYDIGLFPNGDDACLGITVTIRNETEREKLREEMVRLDRLASLGKLSAGIAHEVRNPLTGISLLLDDLHDKQAFSSEEQGMLARAMAEIERVERLITALLNFSAPLRANFIESDLQLLINDILLMMRRPAEKQGVRLDARLEEFPAFSFDPEKMKQALINIVKNSLEALTDGGVITISAWHRDHTMTITVHDTGPGISDEDLPLLFEPFFTRKGAGTGLGLSITHRIIEEHHGSITVTSSPESGTQFCIQLPTKATQLQDQNTDTVEIKDKLPKRGL
ncbi:MAG TPA: HAMP domain-containing protein [Desulfuromonadales bacterium]|nr:HAMP domain-containing protein [Desulfuromonadales bacterium]